MSPVPTRRRRPLAFAVTTVLAATLLSVPATPAVAAQTIGYPTFSGPAVPAPPVGYSTGNTMQSIYNAEAGGTDFWMDRLLARPGNDPAGTWLMTRGRGLFMTTHTPSVIGFGGQVAYWDNISSQNAYSVAITPGTFAEQVSGRWQSPSHWRGVFTSGSIRVEMSKFITHNNVAVTNLTLVNNGSASSTLQLRATSPYATAGSGGELTGSRQVKNKLTTIYPRLAGDGFTVSSGGLNRSVTLAAGQSLTTKVVMGFVTNEIPESLTEYNTYRGYAPSTAFATHVRDYNRWWAENIPYIDVPDPAIKKNIYYRWWLMRYNYLDVDIPGQDYQFPVSIEGVTGYNNAIALTQPMHIDDLKYLRNPIYSYGPWLSVGQSSRNGRFMDNPGDPENWSNSYTQYIAEAAWRSYQIHGGQPAIAGNLARYAEGDVKGQLATYDTNNNGLIEYDWGAMTGNDADAVSFHWRAGNLDRAESAYVYSGAMAAVQAYTLLGNTTKANEMQALADRVRNGVINVLWNPNRQLLEHKHVSTNTHVPWKEINNYYPYSVGLMPNTAQYREALRLYDDPAEYPIFPFFTANQRDKAAAAAAGQPGSNNFSTINSTVQFRLYSSVLRNYPNQWMSAEDYKKLLYWNTWAQYVGGNTQWPDANEFWADWNSGSRTIDYRSWIHHNILGSSNWTVIEDVAGLRPRTDAQIELSPINIGWTHFAVNNLRYRNTDLSVVWDDPADGVTRYAGVPQGYSVYLNGIRAFTVDRLTRVLYNPATGAVTFPSGAGTVTYSAAVSGLQLPQQVNQNSARMVDMFAKAGADLTATIPNLAQGATGTASYTASGTSTGAALDGFPINEPLWGSYGSPNSSDWYEINFGQSRAVDEARIYFRNDRATNRYRAPASYTVQYWNGTAWVNAAAQARTPSVAQANYNRVQFTAVNTQRLRVQFTHAAGYRTGLTEIKVYNRGGTNPNPDPDPGGNLAGAAVPTASYTSGWESVAAINDGAEPPSSNDTVNPRWGTWPNTGEQWALLTWPSAQTITSAQVYFFDDNGGVRLPASWKLQYWTGSVYADVPGTSGYPTTINQYNQVTFPSLSTTRLRVVLQSGAGSVGLLEVKAFD
ncbi:galactose-binding domain-containing protein [Micromonospora sp. LH3U1]|uniref:galactose-binding domain-containing protein n=1 Tax=Micromonospora sp. LH3U1 TaxID=3018339 RepID=UPI00234BF3BF|nr:discoidin domain-containing protein [Micromonospora sp. LH3U1]WCN83292.1 discoidin domain-containing protein [Micromonospora sp. LH3U1]